MNKNRNSAKRSIFLFSALAVCVILGAILAPGLSELPKDEKSNYPSYSTPETIKLSNDNALCDFEFGETKLTVTQDIANILKVSGKTEETVDDLTVIITFGEKSYSLYSEPDGTVREQKFILDVPYCQSVGNVFEINVSYMLNGVLYRSDSGVTLGVVTYNSDNGMLGYPDGAEYINIYGETRPLTGSTVPEDAKLDSQNGMTIIYNGAEIYTIVSSTQYGNAPSLEDCLGGIYSKGSDYLTVYAAQGIEYNLSADNMIISDWKTESGGYVTFTGLEPEAVYTLIARTPATENTLPSVYISVAAHTTLGESEAADKAAFDEKYASLEDKLFDMETGTVTVSPEEVRSLTELYEKLSEEVRALPETTEKVALVDGSGYLSENLEIINKPMDELSVSDGEALNKAIGEYNSLSDEAKAVIGDRLTELVDKKKTVALTELAQLDGASDPSDEIQQIISEYEDKIKDAVLINGTETDELIDAAASAILEQARSESLTSLEYTYSSIKNGESYPLYSDEIKNQIDEAYAAAKEAINGATSYSELKSASETTITTLIRADGKAQILSFLTEDDKENTKNIATSACQRIDSASSSDEIAEIVEESKKNILRQRGKNEIDDYISSLNIPEGKESLITDIKNTAFNTIDTYGTAPEIELAVTRAQAELKLTETYLNLLDSIDENDPFIDAKERNLDTAYVNALDEIRASQNTEEISVALTEGLEALNNAMNNAFLTDFYNKYKNILDKTDISADDLDTINTALDEIRTFTEGEQMALDDYRNNLLLKKMKALSLKLIDRKDGYNDAVIDDYVIEIMLGEVDGDTESDNALNDLLDALADEAELAIEFEKIKTDIRQSIDEIAKDDDKLSNAYELAMSELDALVFSPTEAVENDNYFAQTSAKVNEIFRKFEAYVDFENKREELKLAVKNDVDDKIASGKYSDSGVASLNGKYEAAIAALDAVEYSGDASAQILEEVYAEHMALIAAEKIVRLVSGDCTVIYEPGMDSALSLNFRSVTLKELDKSLIDGKNYSVVTGTLTDDEASDAVSKKKTLLTYEISLTSATEVTFDDGVYTVRILLPENLRSATGLQAVAVNNGAIEIFETRVDGDYIEFKTTHFSEFIILGDKEINLTWVAILLGIILIAELVFEIVFSRKQKKNKKDQKMYSFLPVLAVLLTPNGIIPAIIVLGALSVAGGAVITHQVVKAKKAQEEASTPGTEGEEASELTETNGQTDLNEEQLSEVTENSAESPVSEAVKTEDTENDRLKESAESSEPSDETQILSTDEKESYSEQSADLTDSVENSDNEQNKSPDSPTAVNVESLEKEQDDETAGAEDNASETVAVVDVEAPDEEQNISTAEPDDKSPDSLTAVNVESSGTEQNDAAVEADDKTAKTVTIVDVEAPDEEQTETDLNPENNTPANVTIVNVEAPDDENPEEPAVTEPKQAEYSLSSAIETDETEEEETERRATAKIVNVYAASTFSDDDDDYVPEQEDISDEDDDTEDTTLILPDDTDDDTALDQTVYARHGERVYVTYDYSFESKLILSSEDTQRRYSYLSELLLSYKLGKRRSWKKERYYRKGKNYVQMIFRGKTLCLCMAILPESLENSKYFYENVGQIKKYESVPVMVRIRSGRGCKYAAELIAMMMESAGIPQKYQPEDRFIPLEHKDRDALVGEGLIKRLVTDGNGDVVAADFEAMKNMKFTIESGMPVLKKVSAEEAAMIPDEAAAEFVETEAENDDEITYGRRKGIVNIDTISASFDSGDTVTLAALKAKHLVPNNIHFVKILARGVLDKPLTVKAHDFSMDAVKMIVMAGGNVVKLKHMRV